MIAEIFNWSASFIADIISNLGYWGIFLFMTLESACLPIPSISLPAGIARMNMKKFIFYTFAGSFIWSAFLTYVGLKLGENWQAIETYFRKFNIVIVLLVLVGIVWFVRKHLGLGKQKGNQF